MSEKKVNGASSETLTVQLVVTARQGDPRLSLALNGKDTTPHQLRQKVSQATKIPEQGLKLIYRGRLITDDDTKQAVAEYKLEEGSVMHCIGTPVEEEDKKVAATSAAPTPAIVTPVLSSTSSSTAPPAVLPAPTRSSAVARLPPRAASAAPRPLGSLPIASIPASLQAALRTLRAGVSNLKQYEKALTTLNTILSNILKNPLEDKYRRVKKHNAAFQKHLGGLPGGHETMLVTGFVEETETMEDGNQQSVYVMQTNRETWAELQATKGAVDAALRQATNLASGPYSGTGDPMSEHFASLLNDRTFGEQVRADPDAAGELFTERLLQDPAAMTQMTTTNPAFRAHVQAHMRQNPSGNPLLEVMATLLNDSTFRQQVLNDPRNTMDSVLSRVLQDSHALEQITNLLRDPAFMSYIGALLQQDPANMQDGMVIDNSTMQQQGVATGRGAALDRLMGTMSDPRMRQAWANMASMTERFQQESGVAGTSQPQNGSVDTHDEEQTEEEMIAEAIRRSLQDASSR